MAFFWPSARKEADDGICVQEDGGQGLRETIGGDSSGAGYCNAGLQCRSEGSRNAGAAAGSTGMLMSELSV